MLAGEMGEASIQSTRATCELLEGVTLVQRDGQRFVQSGSNLRGKILAILNFTSLLKERME